MAKAKVSKQDVRAYVNALVSLVRSATALKLTDQDLLWQVGKSYEAGPCHECIYEIVHGRAGPYERHECEDW